MFGLLTFVGSLFVSHFATENGRRKGKCNSLTCSLILNLPFLQTMLFPQFVYKMGTFFAVALSEEDFDEGETFVIGRIMSKWKRMRNKIERTKSKLERLTKKYDESKKKGAKEGEPLKQTKRKEKKEETIDVFWFKKCHTTSKTVHYKPEDLIHTVPVSSLLFPINLKKAKFKHTIDGKQSLIFSSSIHKKIENQARQEQAKCTT